MEAQNVVNKFLCPKCGELAVRDLSALVPVRLPRPDYPAWTSEWGCCREDLSVFIRQGLSP